MVLNPINIAIIEGINVYVSLKIQYNDNIIATISVMPPNISDLADFSTTGMVAHSSKRLAFPIINKIEPLLKFCQL